MELPLLAGTDLWQLVQQGGAVAVLAIVVYALASGRFRTSQEVDAWKERALRAEGQVDTLLPALDKLTSAIDRRTQESAL